MANPDGPDDPLAPEGGDGLPDVRGEPEPGWVEEIRRGREERARRLRALLGPPEDPMGLDPDPPPAEAPTPPVTDRGEGHRERPS
ncbi:MAG: hypothetical protein WB297_10170 [Actinomycetota bacterium]